MIWVIGSFLDTDIRLASPHIIKVSIMEMYEGVEWKGERCVTHHGLYPKTQGKNLWIIYLELLFQTGYV